MLILIDSPAHPQFPSVMALYAASRERDSLGDETAVYEFFLDFFSQKNAFCAAWLEENTCCSVLRIQSFQGGVLVTGVETIPQKRRRGYACKLLSAVLDYLKQRGIEKIYSHVDRKNIASIRLHEKCGFYKLRDTARLLDGSVTTKMHTLCKEQ